MGVLRARRRHSSESRQGKAEGRLKEALGVYIFSAPAGGDDFFHPGGERYPDHAGHRRGKIPLFPASGLAARRHGGGHFSSDLSDEGPGGQPERHGYCGGVFEFKPAPRGTEIHCEPDSKRGGEAFIYLPGASPEGKHDPAFENRSPSPFL